MLGRTDNPDAAEWSSGAERDGDDRLTNGGGVERLGARRPTRRGRVAIAVAVVAGVALALLIFSNLIVTRGITGLAYDDAAATPIRRVAIVFGAGLVDGKPTPMLADRVDGATDLYKRGKVGHLLMTGDNANKAYDEVSAMRDQAMAAGVPSSAITRDYAGLNTYDSCYRARDIFGVRDAVLVTQDYHLSRALYTCRSLGIDAVGLIIPDWQHRSELLTRGQPPTIAAAQYMIREWFARSKAVVAAEFTHPDPTVGGPYVGLHET